ncbi:hypothetical protein A3I27_04625 [Candidatus Giovannonibacteria bacterium RIFCSPLOWO2_02_FULL_43_11b]|uniref:Uncharacterized protein n=1 Tax=Candidatus Giovannonibacteria bacterium RIFCSPHIGHO2_12_FULL_43_15 TaxID=1798341 RepID=A0A1F5WRE6_9BACT|nr:MAG: hypothetical protein A2739_02365 [Candidatus Giovannonibacteria bacterium RIFCSPHIGHO2_01_FULL_43_100]OGF67250.1 MAG: hypothetical protein A3B97_00360 [Candidatus Giovannonibacteria bacterium RIFCSPHIGHO2_02_FULL_43_32]OGF78243.1 MAG: hypothetical protein A3F23_02320 [Candidatus Giovannonibacteria bacterium RIFCSPHIGHO2_12_FULL_43_15]OGF78748.1 MAG: hypothetical protein A3A15_00810 [Candidatus Giovannonibacteria bacterium RIFCSPLOWO2_01_FULL_43_60]OGF90312.1 MAG: hypothetical protein A3
MLTQVSPISSFFDSFAYLIFGIGYIVPVLFFISFVLFIATKKKIFLGGLIVLAVLYIILGLVSAFSEPEKTLSNIILQIILWPFL